MAASQGRSLWDQAIEQNLNLDVSDFEDDGYGDDIDGGDFQQQRRELGSEYSSGESSSENDGDNDRAVSRSSNVTSGRRGRGISSGRARSQGRRGLRGGCATHGGAHGHSILSLSADEDDRRNLQTEDWVEKEFTPNIVPFVQPAYLPINSNEFSKIDYFRQYITDDMVKTIVAKSNEMYLAREGRALNLDLSECNIYIAITLAMSCIGYPILRMYWEQKFRVPMVADNMSRNRFFILRNALKMVNDNDISDEDKSNDRLWKVRPILDAIVNGCRAIPKPRQLSIDEMIIPFTGSCGIKQYCPGKPSPVGLKAFIVADPDGTVCDFHIYQGSTTYPPCSDTSLTLGEQAVLSLSENLIPGHIIYCNRYFTSEKLISELRDRGIMCTGTLMKNRIPKNAREKLKEDKDLKKCGRGTWQVLTNDENNMALTKWQDNKAVMLLSSVHADQTSDTCQRWCKQRKLYVTVPRPEVVKEYNRHMGGVDLADRLLSVCPYRYRTRKWTARFVSHMFDMAITNSWLQFKKDELSRGVPVKKIQQLRSFKMEIAESLLEENLLTDSWFLDPDTDSDEPPRKRTKAPPLPSEKLRKHGALHLPSVGEGQNRCRNPGCKKKTTMICIQCDIHLCLTKGRNCFYLFHSD